VSRKTKPLEQWLSRQVLEGLVRLTQRMRRKSALALGASIGSAAYYLFPRYRRVALANLTRAYGKAWSRRQIGAAAREMFRGVGRTLVEFARLPAMSPEEIRSLVRIEGAEHLEAALAGGRGVLVITAHFGNWEYLGARLVQQGCKLNAIVRPVGNAALDRTVRAIRTGAGYHVMDRSGSLRPALECLRRNELLALLVDQNALMSNIWIDFFGYPAATNVGAAVIARRTGAALLPMFDHRLPDGTHVLRIHPPIYAEPTEDKEQDIQRAMTLLTNCIEQEIRGDPTQWLWLHNRWKHQPVAK
jgi:Kdo2-lipid IVA lauroyltransferase/acyltransferase